MLITDKISDSGDPSTDKQEFKELKINLLCCRYWWFEIWKGQRMSFPYWRLYWNKNEGAYVYYKEKINLKPNQLYLIPPHTPYSTGIVHQRTIPESDYFFKCGRINSLVQEQDHIRRGNILHLFIHFTLGRDYDNVEPGIYCLKKSSGQTKSIERILSTLIKNSSEFSLKKSLDVYSLVLSAVNKVIPNIKTVDKLNYEVALILDYMEKHINTKMTDTFLADKLNMSPGSFSRLFKRTVGQSPSNYLRKIRIDKASNLLLYSNISIDLIADKCGFSDRYHLTKIFTKEKKTTPAFFRKSNGYF